MEIVRNGVGSVQGVFATLYGSVPLSLMFHIELSFENAKAIRGIGQFNDFDWQRVQRLLARIDEMVPRACRGRVNRRNGQRDYVVVVGREGSPVVYVEYRPSVDNAVKVQHLVKRKADFERVVRELARCDEFSMKERDDPVFGKKAVLRLWWD